MPLAQVRFPKFFGQWCAASQCRALPAVVCSATLLSAMALLAGCSSPKAAAVPAAQPSPAVVVAAVHPNSAPSDSGGHSDPGVQSDPFVAIVRAGTMTGYPQATIGQAFEAAFSGAHWSSQQPQGGLRVVTFTGILPPKMRPNCSAAKPVPTKTTSIQAAQTRAGPTAVGSAASPCVQDAKVTFEWTFPSDGRLFHLSRIDPEPWPETHRSTREMLLFIYG
jgi:hypothetical protein